MPKDARGSKIDLLVLVGDTEQRRKWTERHLKPIYREENPLCYSKVVNSVRFVMINSSMYHVLPEQLEFYLAEAAKPKPIVLRTHLPIWIDSWGYLPSGAPGWGTKNDPYWEIERRERWAK